MPASWHGRRTRRGARFKGVRSTTAHDRGASFNNAVLNEVHQKAVCIALGC